MYGWRCRIGLVIPSDNTVMESEFNRALIDIDGISVHSTRIFFEDFSIEALLDMKKELRRAARELKTAEVKVIAFGCTSGSFIGGVTYNRDLIKEIEDETDIMATTTSAAFIEALKELNAKKIAVGTPYSDEVNEKLREFLKENGFSITCMTGLNIASNIEIGKKEPYVAYKLAKDVNTVDSDCIFISCTDFRTFDVIKLLEDELGKPIVTANQATLWHTLKLSEVPIALTEYGILLGKNCNPYSQNRSAPKRLE